MLYSKDHTHHFFSPYYFYIPIKLTVNPYSQLFSPESPISITAPKLCWTLSSSILYIHRSTALMDWCRDAEQASFTVSDCSLFHTVKARGLQWNKVVQLIHKEYLFKQEAFCIFFCLLYLFFFLSMSDWKLNWIQPLPINFFIYNNRYMQ